MACVETCCESKSADRNSAILPCEKLFAREDVNDYVNGKGCVLLLAFVGTVVLVIKIAEVDGLPIVCVLLAGCPVYCNYR